MIANLAARRLIQTSLQGVSFISEAIGSSLKDPLVVLFRNLQTIHVEDLDRLKG